MNDNKMITIRWFPPSWLLAQACGKVIYIDPAWIQKYFDSYHKKVIFSHYPEPMDGLPEPDLPKADYIFITHHHQDHIKTVTLKRLTTPKTGIYAPAKCERLIGRRFIEVKPGDEIKLDEVTVKVVYAYNTSESKSTRKTHHKGECVGYLLSICGKIIYHAGDTDVIPEMKELGRVDVAFLPIGGTFTMNATEAAIATGLISPSIAVPMHYLNTKPEMFGKAVRGKNGAQVKIFQIGEEFIVS